MIVLNTTKELINVENWADIEARPGFTPNVDPNAHKRLSIIGRYLHPERRRCDLPNCHTPHAKGYIVVTTDGRETNIGKDCGKNYFGVDFETMTQQFERDVTEKENRETLFTFSFRTEELRAKLTELRRQVRGADWVYRLTRALVEGSKGCPSVLVRQLGTMVKTRNPILLISREATSQEVENMESTQGRRLPRPQYIDEAVAQIDGIEALYPEADVRKLLVFDIEEPLKKFEGENIDSMTFERLRHWARWVNTVIEPTVEAAARAVDHGRRLLVAENLQPLERLLGRGEDIDQFAKYLKTLRT